MHSECWVVDPQDFNDRMVEVRGEGSPYAIIRTGRHFPQKILHAGAIQYLKSIDRGNQAALEFQITFGSEYPAFSLMIVDSGADDRVMAMTCGLRKSYDHPEQLPANTDLARYFSTENTQQFENFERAIEAIRAMESFQSFNNSGGSCPEFFRLVEPTSPTLSSSSLKGLLLGPFFSKGGILNQLLDDPFRTVNIHRPAIRNGEHVLVELRARAHRSADDETETRQFWSEPFHDFGSAGFPPFLNPTHTLDYDIRTALTGDGIPKDAVSALLLLVLTVGPIESISMAVYLHTENTVVRLLGFVCPSKDGTPTPSGLIGIVANFEGILEERFGLKLRQGVPLDRVPRPRATFTPSPLPPNDIAGPNDDR